MITNGTPSEWCAHSLRRGYHHLRFPDAFVEETELNGAPGLLVKAGGRIIVASVIDTDGERIHSVFAVANPDKLDAMMLAAS